MKVVFFSESGIVGKVDRTFPNARNDIAWSIMMDADWCPYGVKPSGNYDLGVVTIPKTKPNLASSLASLISIGKVIVTPTPTAGPLIAAMIGFGQSNMDKVVLPPPSLIHSGFFL